MYRLIKSAVILSPTVLTKYPSSQNSPPHNSFLTSGNFSNISLAEILFSMPTTCAIEYLGGKPKNICT